MTDAEDDVVQLLPVRGQRLERALHVRRGFCRPCGKWGYPSRKQARKARCALHPGEAVDTYRCPADAAVWHIGHRQDVLPVARHSLRGYRQAAAVNNHHPGLPRADPSAWSAVAALGVRRTAD
ncbi:MAG: hypothetical protein JO272_01135 [Pseudonocardiales bacterium]|nr:hypothetical protein [Pseudonocardiales bacterium]